MEIDIERAKELIAQREEIDAELTALFTGEKKKRSPVKETALLISVLKDSSLAQYKAR